MQGVHEARGLHIPVHAIGFGDPKQESPVLIDCAGFLRYEDRLVKTRLGRRCSRKSPSAPAALMCRPKTSRLPLNPSAGNLKERRRQRNGASLAAGTASAPGLVSGPPLLCLSRRCCFEKQGKPKVRRQNPLQRIRSKDYLARVAVPSLSVLVLALAKIGVARPMKIGSGKPTQPMAATISTRRVRCMRRRRRRRRTQDWSPSTRPPCFIGSNASDGGRHRLLLPRGRPGPEDSPGPALWAGHRIVAAGPGKNVAILDRAVDAFTACA